MTDDQNDGLRKGQRMFVDGPFGQVHVRLARPVSQTSTPPLICLHQSPRSSVEYRKFLERACNSRVVVAIDSPGHGESDLPSSEDEATISNYAKSAWAAVQALGFDQVDLLGNHTGASVAVEMASQRPDKVRRIVLISAPVFTDEEAHRYNEMFQPIPLDEKGTRFRDLWARAIEYRGPDVTLKDLAANYAEYFRAGDAYEWGHKAAFAYNDLFRERLQALEHRIVVINPGDLLFDVSLRAAPLLKNGEIRNFPEWGIGFLDAFPEEAVAAVESALEG